jgi:nucleotide-binding universal stress UspA family protein
MALAHARLPGQRESKTLRTYPARAIEDAREHAVNEGIVVGVTGLASSRTAVQWAAARASRTGEPITLLHVEPLAPGQLPVGLRGIAFVGGSALLARERRFVRSVAPGVAVRVERVRGSVMWALRAASMNAAMVVVGTHKSGFIHGTVYGSTSLQLAATAGCPVVVVPARLVDPTAGVVLGADGSPAGRTALDFAALEADRLGTDLLMVRVLAAGGDGDSASSDASARLEASLLLEDFRESAVVQHLGAAVNARIVHGSAARVLVTMSTGARLLVLGDGRPDAGRHPVALGAVAHDALINIQAPTAVVHVRDTDTTTAASVGIGSSDLPEMV